MVLNRLFIGKFLFLGILLLPKLAFAYPPIPIESIDELESAVKTLHKSGAQADDICVILDFHGVITNQAYQSDYMTLKGNIKRFLSYLREENISYVISTAWNKLDDIAHCALVKRELVELLDIDITSKATLCDVILGKDQTAFKAFKNGRLVSLKYASEYGVSEDPYFRQKAFASEFLFPNKKFGHTFFVDDDLGTHKLFKKDYMKTTNSQSPVYYYHLKTPEVVQQPAAVERATYVKGDTTPLTLVNSDGDIENDNFNEELIYRLDNLSSPSNIGTVTSSLKDSRDRSGRSSLKSSKDKSNPLNRSQ